MTKSTGIDRRYSRSVVLMILGGIVVSVCGCGGYTGPSEYEKFKKKQQGFAGVIASAGGNAVKEGKTMHGFQMTGWLIDLSNAEITDDLIGKIIEVAQDDPVFQLNFSGSSITDDQLGDLDTGTVLQKTVDLNLSGTKITDAGLDRVSNICCLTTLNLKGTSATAEGAKRLGGRKIANPQTPPPFKKQPELTI